MNLDLFRFFKSNWLAVIFLAGLIALLLYLGQNPTTIGIIIAGIALLLNWDQIKENNKIREIQTLTEFYKDIDKLSEDIFKLEAEGERSKKTRIKAKRWDSRLFNRIELFAFFINRGYIQKNLTEFFEDSIVGWYEKIFLENATEKEKTDDKYYIEFKTLYHKIKLKKVVRLEDK